MTQAKPKTEDRQARLDNANQLICAIAGCGRRFFAHKDRVAYLELDARGRVWFHDEYSERRIYIHYPGRWRGFTHGGTLKSLIEALRDYVTQGKQLRAGSLGPWPQWYSGTDPWGYGEGMVAIREAAVRLNIVKTKPDLVPEKTGEPAESAPCADVP